MSLMLGWTVPRLVRKSKESRERMTLQLDQQSREMQRAAAISNHAADRVELAAVRLLERHKQGMMDAAAEIYRR